MPIAIALIGILLLVAAWQNTIGLLGQTLANDVDSSFMAWLGVVFILGIIGYMSDTARTPTRALLALIVLAYFLNNNGIIAKFQQELNASYSPAQGPAQQGPTGPAPISISGGSSSLGAGGILGSLFGNAVGAATTGGASAAGNAMLGTAIPGPGFP